METMTFNTWQLWKLNKFKLKPINLKEIKLKYIEFKDDRKTYKWFHDFKHYACKCGQYELLWFIDICKWECRDCSWFNNK